MVFLGLDPALVSTLLSTVVSLVAGVIVAVLTVKAALRRERRAVALDAAKLGLIDRLMKERDSALARERGACARNVADAAEIAALKAQNQKLRREKLGLVNRLPANEQRALREVILTGPGELSDIPGPLHLVESWHAEAEVQR